MRKRDKHPGHYVSACLSPEDLCPPEMRGNSNEGPQNRQQAMAMCINSP